MRPDPSCPTGGAQSTSPPSSALDDEGPRAGPMTRRFFFLRRFDDGSSSSSGAGLEGSVGAMGAATLSFGGAGGFGDAPSALGGFETLVVLLFSLGFEALLLRHPLRRGQAFWDDTARTRPWTRAPHVEQSGALLHRIELHPGEVFAQGELLGERRINDGELKRKVLERDLADAQRECLSALGELEEGKKMDVETMSKVIENALSLFAAKK